MRWNEENKFQTRWWHVQIGVCIGYEVHNALWMGHEFQNIGIELVPVIPLATPRHSRFDPELTLIRQYTWRSLRFLQVNIFLHMNLPPVPSFRTFTESVRSNHMMTPWTQQCLFLLMRDPRSSGHRTSNSCWFPCSLFAAFDWCLTLWKPG